MEKLDDHHKRILLSYADDIDVLNFCLSNKRIGDVICNEEFWRDRFLNRYGSVDKGYTSWKNFYMYIISIRDKANRKKRSVLYYAVKTKNKYVLDYFLTVKDRNSFDYLEGLEAAAEINDENLIKEFLKNRDERQPNIIGNDLNLYHYYERDNITRIMKGAIRGNYKNITDTYLNNRKLRFLNDKEISELIKLAIDNDTYKIGVSIYKYINKYRDDLLYYSVEKEKIPFIKFFIAEGADPTVGLKAAVKIDNSDFIQYFLSIGGKFNEGK